MPGKKSPSPRKAKGVKAWAVLKRGRLYVALPRKIKRFRDDERLGFKHYEIEFTVIRELPRVAAGKARGKAK